MSGVVPAFAICVAVLLMCGCAADPPPEPVAKRGPPARTRIVTVKQSCTTTLVPEDVCATKKYCTKDHTMTCAEAYYRLMTCKHSWLDGGAAVPREGQPNGIPCEDRCGKDAKEMAREISKQPFLPRTRSVTTCSPAGTT
jgi:hypothetical protein